MLLCTCSSTPVGGREELVGSLATMCILGTELRASGLVVSALTYSAIWSTPRQTFIVAEQKKAINKSHFQTH